MSERGAERKRIAGSERIGTGLAATGSPAGRARSAVNGEVVFEPEIIPKVEALSDVDALPNVEATVKVEVVPEVEALSEVDALSDGNVLSDVEVEVRGARARASAESFSPVRRSSVGVDRDAPDKPPFEPAPADAVASADDHGPEWCAIVAAGTKRRGEFRVVVLERGAQRRVVARSPSFRVPRSHRIRNRGEPRDAHDLLVKHLVASGWRRVQARGRWHDSAFIRHRPDPQGAPVRRLLICCHREGRTARFLAAELDAFGNGTPVDGSEPFSVTLRGSLLRPTDEARAVHEALLARLRSAGWSTADSVGPEWYAQVLHWSAPR